MFMKQNNNLRGFIQIPILIAIIVGVVLVGGAGYVGVKKYQSNKARPMQEDVSTTQAKRVALSNSEIVDRVKPATVFIETKKGAGSGMIIDENGYILTNAHVVWDVSAAKVKLSDDRTLSAEVIGRDEIIDLAILKIVGDDFPKVSFGDSDNVTQGEDVFTLGYPFGLEGDVSFKEGTISRRISDGDATYLETSAEIHHGNSGDPLVNKYGEVVGINTASYGQSIKGVTVGETIKLAIPINVAKELISELKGGRKIIIDHAQYEPPAPKESAPAAPSQSQILQDQANRALLEALEKKDTDEAWERYYSFNDAWRENPARNCRNEATYSYEIAKLVMGALQDNLVRKYGTSGNWRAVIDLAFQQFCVDRGY